MWMGFAHLCMSNDLSSNSFWILAHSAAFVKLFFGAPVEASLQWGKEEQRNEREMTLRVIARDMESVTTW